MTLDFRILGPLEVVADGETVELRGRKQRALLALLLLRANEIVPADVLIEELWGGTPPDTAANTLQVYVSQVRSGAWPPRSNRRISSANARPVPRWTRPQRST